MIRNFILILLFIAGAVATTAQPTPVITGEKDRMLIGEPVKFTLELRAVDRNASVRWILPDSLTHFEYIRIDSSDLLKREITITSWDSGVWELEPIKAIVPSNVNGQPIELLFPAKEITVAYDTTGSKIMNDVKPIIEAGDANEQWIGYTIAAITLLSFLLLIALFRKWKTKEALVFEEDASVTPLDEFLKSIARLQQQSWSTQQEQKQQFSDLSFSVKRYLQRMIRKPVLQRTTDGVSTLIAHELSREQLLKLVQWLRLTDAVKFAKYKLPEEECSAVLTDIKQWVQQVDEQLR